MSAVREAVVLPALFLTVTLLGGLEPGAPRPWTPASPFSLLLAFLLVGLLFRSGALSPDKLLHPARGTLANANGLVVLLSLFAAAAQVVHMLTPRSGLPSIIVGLVLALMMLNTFVLMPGRERVLRGLAVVLGSAFVLKFVLLASLADPDASRTRRVLVALFDAATLGTISQEPIATAAGYLAFGVTLLFLAGVAALPRVQTATGAALSWPGHPPSAAPRLTIERPRRGERQVGDSTDAR